MAYFIYSQAENILNELKNCPVYLQKMKNTMFTLKEILLDAEEKQENNHNVRNWLKELQYVFNQIEDSIDEFKWDCANLKQEGIGGQQVRAPFSCFDPIIVPARESKPARKAKKLCGRLDAVADKMYEFHFQEHHSAPIRMETTHTFLSATEVSIGFMEPNWQLLYPLTDAPKVYHDNRYDDILNDFQKSTHGFFHIVGEAGIGKSTLAKFIYNHPKIVNMFTSRFWVCVKESFDTQRLMKEVYSFAVGKEICDHYDLIIKQFLFKVQRFLRERTFLLVFQDLSITNLDNRSMFKNLLGMGNHGSKIIVTTQSEAIADALRLTKVYKTEKQSKQNMVATECETVQVSDTTEPSNIIREEFLLASPLSILDGYNMKHQTIFKVERLSEHNSFSLFKDYAFRNTEKAQCPESIEIAKRIVRKCKGVPLAIKCLGSLLSSKASITEWRKVNQKLQAQEVEDGNNILPILRLCYTLMPSHLRRCFLYCSQLPNDSVFTSNDLIQQWMAHGLLQSPKENSFLSMENIGEKYFKELWSRCFVQEIEEYGLGYWFKLHPLIQKLAQVLTQDQTESSLGNKPVTEIRSMGFQVGNMDASIVDKCISNFKCLRLMYLGNTNLEEIPNAIGTLKYLRYLDLQGNKKIKQLPDSICDLQRLQTLILASCSSLEELPNNIRNLINLRYLWVTGNKLHLHKNGVGTMTSLRFLAIGGCDNLQLLFERPKCLVDLETLMIYDCNTLKSLPNNMRYLKSLQNLMICNCKQLKLTLKDVEFKLQRFTIRELPNVDELPQWLQGSTETLRILQIINCPIRMEKERLESYKAFKRMMIYGDVRFEMGAARCGFEHRNLAMHGGTMVDFEIMRNYY